MPLIENRQLSHSWCWAAPLPPSCWRGRRGIWRSQARSDRLSPGASGSSGTRLDLPPVREHDGFRATVSFQSVRHRILRASEGESLVAGLATIAVVTALSSGFGVTHPTTVALSFVLVVLVVATVSSRRVAIATSVMAFACFNFFFLPPFGTFVIEDSENWIALFALLVVSTVASHLSSEIRRRTQEVANAEKDAELVRQSAQLKSALIASLRHDLRTPLTAVMVAANNLNAADLSDAQRREQAEIVRVELERLNQLFQNMEDLAKIDIDALEVEPEWVQPAEIAEAAVRQAERALDPRRVHIHVSPEGMLVHLDPRLTSAALAHLLENAGQYSPPSAPVDIRLSVFEAELHIAVRDRGPGISPADVERVFERSYRGTGARQTRAGTGMGLSITRGLLAAAGGHVRVENAPGGGAVFTMTIPITSRTTSMAVEAT